MNTQLSSKEEGNLQAICFEEHSKMETLTPSDSLLDLESPPQFSSQDCGGRERQLLQQASYLREQNIFLREQLEQIKSSYNQMVKGQQKIQPVFSNEDVNRVIEENRALQGQNQRFSSEISALKRQLGDYRVSLREIGRVNDEYYRKVVSLTNQLERQRRDYRTALKELETRAEKAIQVERGKISTLVQQLASEREESQSLRIIIEESNREIERLNSLKDKLQEQCETLVHQRQELQGCMDSLQGEALQQQLDEIRSAIQDKRAENQDLKVQLENFEEDYRSLMQQRTHFKQLYEKQLLLQEENQQTIMALQKEISLLRTELQQQKNVNNVPFLYNPSNNIIRKMKKPDQSENCSASTANKIKVLCNQTTRRTIISQLKRLISQIGRVDLENKITSLMHELYMDAEYRERTNLQMQEIIVQLQAKITQLERHRPEPNRKNEGRNVHNDQYVVELQESLSRYERLLLNADGQKLRLIDQISALKKENYQVRLQLANSQLDSETEELIEQLTLQLQQEKRNGRILEEENEQLREEIKAIQWELHQKNKRIKLLMLNLNKRQQEQRV